MYFSALIYSSHFIQVESEIMQLDEEERKLFLEDLGISKSGLDSLVCTHAGSSHVRSFVCRYKQRMSNLGFKRTLQLARRRHERGLCW